MEDNNNWKEKLEEIRDTEIANVLTPVKTWFEQLPPAGRIAVGLGGVVVSLSLLNTFLRLVSSLFSIGFLVLGVYLFYKFFIAPRSSNN